jgi:hypothetical protein
VLLKLLGQLIIYELQLLVVLLELLLRLQLSLAKGALSSAILSFALVLRLIVGWFATRLRPRKYGNATARWTVT